MNHNFLSNWSTLHRVSSRVSMKSLFQPMGVLTGFMMGTLVLGVTLIPLSAAALPDVFPERVGRVDTTPITTAGDRSVSSSDSLATITTDTGALAQGDKDFTRYRVPGMCLALAENARSVLRRSLAAKVILDTIQTTAPERDTLPRGVVTLARACGARFTVANVTPWDLPDLFMLALLAERDSLADAVLQRRVTLVTNTAAKGWLLQQAATIYLAAEPARVAAATAVVAQADALGLAAAAARLAAHQALLDFATQTFDRVRMRQEAERILALGRAAPFDSIKYHWGPVYFAYVGLGRVAYFEHPDSARELAPQLAQRAIKDLARFPNGRLFPPGSRYGMWAVVDWKTETVEDAERQCWGTQDVQALGTVLPALESDVLVP